MARSTGAVIPGIILATALILMGVGAILVLALTGASTAADGDFARRVFGILRVASMQAALSALGSVLVAIPVAVALSRLRHHAAFYNSMRLICGVAFIIPTTVAASGLLEIWGRSGLIADACRFALAGNLCDGITVYGLHGVVLGHMFLNIPLMVLMFLPLLEAIPAQHHGLAHHLGMGRRARFRLMELPAIAPAIPHGLVLVFLLCFSSFALVLMLGGGPRVTTLEVEIYSAIRFDFDFRAAAILSLVQCASAVVLVAVLGLFGKSGYAVFMAGNPTPPMPFRDSRMVDGVALAVFALLVILPVVMVILAGIRPAFFDVITHPRFAQAFSTSLGIASISAVAATIMAMILAHARTRLKISGRPVFIIDGGVMLYLVIPSIVFGTAAFIVLRARGDAFAHAFWVVVLANSLLALPFATRLLEGRMRLLYPRHDRLATSLGIGGFNRWRLLTLPAMSRETGIALGLAAAMSIGDLGVIALFAGENIRTLPWMLYSMAGSYQFGDAKALALILLALALFLLVAGRVLPGLLMRRARHA